MAEKNKKQTPFEAEKERLLTRVFEYKRNAELNVVSAIYKTPDLIFESEKLSVEDFDEDACRVFFAIAYGVLVSEEKKTLDPATINFYLDKHPKLKAKYEEYGSWEEISGAAVYANTDNFEAYLTELQKWQAIIVLTKRGFVNDEMLSRFADISLEEIYNEYEYFLNSIFVNKVEGVQAYNAFEGSKDHIIEMDRGDSVGFPLYNAELLTGEICGFNYNGNIYGLGANSGTGKSTMAFNYLVPSAIDNNEGVVFIINEEDHKKFKTELIIWVANNIFKVKFQKQVFRRGGFLADKEIQQLMDKCSDWIEERKNEGYLTIIPLKRYTVDKAVKIINKYSALGYKIFVLDTFKESANARTDEIYRSMMRDMVALYDVVKPEAKNVGLFVTYQLGKASLKMRHLTNNEIGQAKSIVDVMSVNLMMRRPFDDEFEGGKKAIQYWRRENKAKIISGLKKDKEYMITFITKNRFGKTDAYQIVSECDLSTNTYKDVGYCNIIQDW